MSLQWMMDGLVGISMILRAVWKKIDKIVNNDEKDGDHVVLSNKTLCIYLNLSNKYIIKNQKKNLCDTTLSYLKPKIIILTQL